MASNVEKFFAYIPAASKDDVNLWIKTNIPDAGPNAFSAPFSSDGETTTHYATNWRITGKARGDLISYLNSQLGQTYYSFIGVLDDIHTEAKGLSVKALDAT